MPEKKARTAKTTARKPATASKTSRGDRYSCEVCGLSVVVDDVCGCEEVHEIVCCEQPMKKTATRAKAAR